jgi:hypothetical protein
MNDSDTIVEVVDHATDRPAFSDRGDQPVHAQETETPPAAPKKPRKRRNPRAADEMSDEELLRDAGVEPIFSTSEAAEFFDRSNQWLYWGLREQVFTEADGTPIDPDRIGHPVRGRRRFTIPLLREIMKSSYRRGNLDGEQLTTIMRRIKFAEQGVEWREREGWHYTHLGRNRYRWLKPDMTVWNSKSGEWNLHPDVKLRSHTD